MAFLNPLDALIPEIRFSFFAEFWVRVTSGAWGSASVGIFFLGGGRQLSPLGGGGAVAAGLYRPHPIPHPKRLPTPGQHSPFPPVPTPRGAFQVRKPI